MMFILENMVFLLKYHIRRGTLEGAQERATGDATQEKVLLEFSENSQEKTCARASFLIRLQA